MINVPLNNLNAALMNPGSPSPNSFGGSMNGALNWNTPSQDANASMGFSGPGAFASYAQSNAPAQATQGLQQLPGSHYPDISASATPLAPVTSTANDTSSLFSGLENGGMGALASMVPGGALAYGAYNLYKKLAPIISYSGFNGSDQSNLLREMDMSPSNYTALSPLVSTAYGGGSGKDASSAMRALDSLYNHYAANGSPLFGTLDGMQGTQNAPPSLGNGGGSLSGPQSFFGGSGVPAAAGGNIGVWNNAPLGGYWNQQAIAAANPTYGPYSNMTQAPNPYAPQGIAALGGW